MIKLCPGAKCSLMPAKSGKHGVIKYSCYNEKDMRCPLALMDAGIGLVQLAMELKAARRRKA